MGRFASDRHHQGWCLSLMASIQSDQFLQSERAFKLIYPYANLALDLTFLGYDLAYLFDRSDSYRPWHRWLGLRIERRGPANEQVGFSRPNAS